MSIDNYSTSRYSHGIKYDPRHIDILRTTETTESSYICLSIASHKISIYSLPVIFKFLYGGITRKTVDSVKHVYA